MDERQNENLAQNHLVRNGKGGQEESLPRKKTYEKPEVLYMAPLEAMAATCSTFPGKATGVCGTAFS